MKWLLGTIAALTLLLTGCAGTKEYLPIIDASLDGAKGVTEATKTVVVGQKDVVGCYVTSSLLTALESAQQVVATWTPTGGKKGLIPEVDVDLGTCHALLEEAGTPVEPLMPEDAETQVRALVGGLTPAIFAVTNAILSSSDVGCRDLVIARAVMDYINGAVQPVIDELVTPDGKMMIPAVAMDLSECDEPEPAPAPPKAGACAPCPPCK